MKYVLTFFLFTILLIPIYLYYIDIISTLNSHFPKVHISSKVEASLTRSSQTKEDYVNGFNIANIDAFKVVDLRNSGCMQTAYPIESSDFNSTR